MSFEEIVDLIKADVLHLVVFVDSRTYDVYAPIRLLYEDVASERLGPKGVVQWSTHFKTTHPV